MKKEINKITLLVTLTIMVCSFGFAQTEGKYTIDKSDWKQFEEQNGVLFSQKVIEYHDDINDQHKEFYLVRITNTTEEDMQIHAKRTLWYDGKCFNCDSDADEYMMDFEIEAGEELIGDPVKRLNDHLVIFKKFLKYRDIAEVTKFEFDKLTVKIQ